MQYLTLEQLRDGGYLQEVNRRFFHPLGLALEAGRFTAGTAEPMVIRVQDHRDDPEGVIFADPPDPAKAARVLAEEIRRSGPRLEALGYTVQPTAGI